MSLNQTMIDLGKLSGAQWFERTVNEVMDEDGVDYVDVTDGPVYRATLGDEDHVAFRYVRKLREIELICFEVFETVEEEWQQRTYQIRVNGP